MNQNTAKQEAERIIEMFKRVTPFKDDLKWLSRLHVQGVIDELEEVKSFADENSIGHFNDRIDFCTQVLHHIQTKI